MTQEQLLEIQNRLFNMGECANAIRDGAGPYSNERLFLAMNADVNALKRLFDAIIDDVGLDGYFFIYRQEAD